MEVPMKASLFVLAAFVAVTAASAVQAEYRWKTVGGNPYRGSPEWAITNSGYPSEAQEALLAELNVGRRRDGRICGGDQFDFVTFGKNGIKYEVVADWSATRCYAVDQYTAEVGDAHYTLILVWKCGNWGGQTARMVPPSALVVEVVPPIILGMLPAVECPDSSGCGVCNGR